ncbi:hypothetical protein NCAS_0C01930 [Naumovozyma castellii]|uniref:Peptide-N(4)-(N-acetyl-beta-glucosaminyl)asparagine amidase n=1 Tax=Naumovozyma castellii TaxID=27288 RepID=G0VCH3_NAUCA|nr:hypothetical protein NCAS_0C01930 [Naumovozyma castellii CBS 4309]CCC69183.1 hypothetical protein NCAS_0C01930 [Naumovozyma castellii CBS 4309]
MVEEIATEPDFEYMAATFLKKYKEIIVGKFRSDPDTTRFNRLMQTNNFARQLVSMSGRNCTIYENGDWYSIVLEVMDLDLIYKNVDEQDLKSDDEYPDVLVRELLRYFKQDFFKWCDKPECHTCGNSDRVQFHSTEPPNSEEAKYECGSVEVFRCDGCGSMIRFPRYNDPIKLLETRTGRCGEWCNLFTLVLKSFGLEARYVWNREDHVWCEYYSPYLNRWVHVDSCEQSFDQPYIYSINWNKSMSYCIAFSKDDVTDVSKRYILKNELPRDQISELDLQFICTYLTKRLRRQRTDDELFELFKRDERERFEWMPKVKKTEQKSPTKTLEPEKGRQSGSAQWKSARGEDGK